MIGKLNGCIVRLKMMTYLKKYNTVWDKASVGIKKEFESYPVCNKKKSKNQNRTLWTYRFLQ